MDDLLVQLRSAMLDAGIGLDRFDEMMGEPACVLDVAIHYFVGLKSKRESLSDLVCSQWGTTPGTRAIRVEDWDEHIKKLNEQRS